MLLQVSVNKLSSGSLLLYFAKVMFIKIVSWNTLLIIQCGRVAAKYSSKLPDDSLLTETCRRILM
jgi:hypothetical protein